ncbi:hypothetical protein OCU04_004571 [Sclerotinia nivalis]|uniref:BTB domain-containing protein n=1 Tax=Sclerotinia nivalis TaxID=352851 RepID=A0A9X0AQP4_9HELO|nr:hypothetical protein OCU04_004571 [Sclerotinia nivalis]
MVSKDPGAPEKLIFDSKGDVLLIFSRRPEDKDEGKDALGKPASLKRKAPNDAPETVTMLVSSKHMTLASPVFEAMLSGGRFKEGVELLAKGKAEIELPDNNPDAFSIIAQIIHGRNQTVPQQVSFKILLELAILTEKYQTHEIIGCISDYWVRNLFGATTVGLKRPVFRNEMISYLFISLVFGHDANFEQHTRLAILYSDETFGSDLNNRFYIPSSLIG